jgi:hypothetical protein
MAIPRGIQWSARNGTSHEFRTSPSLFRGAGSLPFINSDQPVQINYSIRPAIPKWGHHSSFGTYRVRSKVYVLVANFHVQLEFCPSRPVPDQLLCLSVAVCDWIGEIFIAAREIAGCILPFP